jgi:hypothetical protein
MGFLAPWFLTGLAALGVPVFVHLLRKHVTIPRPVSSLMFFERGIQSSTRHRRLKYFLLLTLRLALLLFVVLAFSDPFLRRPANLTEHLQVIVLDNSYSMRAGTRFLDARQQALNLLAAKPRSQRAQIMSLGGAPQLLTQPTSDSDLLRSTLESVQVGDSHSSFGDLGRAVRALSETSRQAIDLHLFSDMQRTAMPGNFADLVFPSNVKLTLHQTGKATSAPNWTIDSVNAPTELTDPKDVTRSRVQTTVVGFGTSEAERTVSLVVNGKVIASHKVTVPANGRAIVEFAPLDLAYGFNRCEVRIENDDSFPADNRGLFAVRRVDPQRVLFIHATTDERSTLYFGAALNAASHGAFVLQPMVAEQTSGVDPSKFAFIVLSDATSLPSIFEHTLEQYISKGGNVLIAVGLNSGRSTRIPLWKEGLPKPYNFVSPTATGIGQVDFTYPALEQASPARDNGGWAGTKIYYAIAVDPSHARVAARLSDGTPFLLERQIGEGHLLLFASGFDNITNDLPLHPVFVSFIDKTSRYLAGMEQHSGARVVDSFVQLRHSLDVSGRNTTSEIIDPQGRRPLSLNEARTIQVFRLAQTGFYQIHFPNGHDGILGVNPDRRESDLEPISTDLQMLWTGSNGASLEADKKNATGEKYQHIRLWWYVMLLALVVAIAEIALSSRYLVTQREEL